MSATEVRLTVGGEDANNAHTDVMKQEIDMKDRDPTDMNAHLKITFEDVFAEPHPTIFAFDGVWGTSFKVFRCTKLWAYRILTAIFAVPLAVFWGIYFAVLSCCTIWCCQPCVRAYQIELSCFKGFWLAILDALYRPLCETLGYCFYNVRVNVVKTV